MTATSGSRRSPESGTPARVLYVQYTDPAAYPPVEHGALLLAERGCDVLLLGTSILGDALRFARHARISVRLCAWKTASLLRKLHYARFALWVGGHALAFRPDWIYASDPLAAPVAVVLRMLCRAKLVYHEHDAPEAASAAFRVVGWLRRMAARRASICVAPNAGRAEALRRATGCRDVVVVGNMPLLRDVRPEGARDGAALKLVYHGSIVPARLPASLFEALSRVSPSVTLAIAGYDPSGGTHLASLKARVHALGLKSRVTFVGTVPDRARLLDLCASGHVGVSLMPSAPDSFNEQTMAGASNKPFDYLACGLPVLVPDGSSWRETYVAAGVGRACTPESPDSIADAIRWFLDHPAERAAMGARGRERIVSEWNYEHAFAPVLDGIAPLEPAPMVDAAVQDAAASRM